MISNILNKIKRVFRCQKRKFYYNKWCKIKPFDFFRDPRRVTSLWYASREGRKPNFKKPIDFNERLMLINCKAYEDEEQRKLRIERADKYTVRQFVSKCGFGNILNEIYGVYDEFEDIDFDKLPDQFVLKLTNGSGYNYICTDKSKLDKDKLKMKFNKWMIEVNNHGLTTGEWHYNLIETKIIAEKYLSMLGESISLVDYKFHCINQRVYGVYVCYDRMPEEHKVNYDHYDPDWNLTDGVLPMFHLTQRAIRKPINFEKMKQIAEKLSEGTDYVRVDLYEIDGNILFGELTYTPMGNFLPYTHKQLVDMEEFYKKTKK